MPVSADLRRAVAVLLLVSFALPVLAQEGLGPGRRAKRPDICFNPDELEAEAIVRGGMVIRDHARACARRGLDGTILQVWGKFDEDNAQALRDAVRLRAEAYQRNWPDDPYALQRANNATVASRQILDFAPEECIALGNLVDGLRTWDDYMRHIRLTELGQVKNVYKQCPQRRGGGQRR